MSFMFWDSSFETGIHEFDEHHRHLVSLLNMAYDGFTYGAGRDELAAVLNELVDYATYHFNAEEHWMDANSYPKFSEHCEEHNKFSERVIVFQNDFHSGTSDLSMEVLQFLQNWLVVHILKTDADYGTFSKGLPRHTSGLSNATLGY